MGKIFFRGLAVFALLTLSYCITPHPGTGKNTYMVIVSLDGFRWDYPDHSVTPTLDSIERHGVKAKSLKPSFPSKTFPNHYSMATGLYPDHHGIVQNSFYDPEFDEDYYISNREAVENPKFYGGEPIWVTAEKQDVRSASYFWVGSEAPVSGYRPSYWKRYEHNFPFEQRIDSVIYWLNLPEEERPHLILLYFHEPDNVGHAYGPESVETNKEVHYLDSLMGDLCKKLNQLPFAKDINVIITSDHGMSEVSGERMVFVDQIIDTAWFNRIIGHNPNYLFDVKDNFYDTALASLQDSPHIKAWKHGELPEELNYGTNPRTMDFIVVADSSWSISFSDNPIEYMGAHGYDNRNTDMHAIFYACGPAFKKNYKANTFENVDIYPLIARILGLFPAEVDGSVENVEGMLVN